MKEMILEKGKLGSAIRNARINSKITQEELAEMLGVTPTHLKHIESEHRKPSIEVLFMLSHILHMSLDALFLDYDCDYEKKRLISEINLMLSDCEPRDLRAISAALQEITSSDK